LRDTVNRVRSEGTSALDRLVGEDLVDLTIVLSLFENEIMSYVPPNPSASSNQEINATSFNGSASSSHDSPAPVRSIRLPFRQGQRDFEAKLRQFYRKLESKGYGQGPNKFKIPVRRSHLLEDAYTKIMSASKKEMQRYKLQISFVSNFINFKSIKKYIIINISLFYLSLEKKDWITEDRPENFSFSSLDKCLILTTDCLNIPPMIRYV
jgi:hypothetical protein